MYEQLDHISGKSAKALSKSANGVIKSNNSCEKAAKTGRLAKTERLARPQG